MIASSRFSSSFVLFGRAEVSLYIIFFLFFFFSFYLSFVSRFIFLSFRIRVVGLS